MMNTLHAFAKPPKSSNCYPRDCTAWKPESAVNTDEKSFPKSRKKPLAIHSHCTPLQVCLLLGNMLLSTLRASHELRLPWIGRLFPNHLALACPGPSRRESTAAATCCCYAASNSLDVRGPRSSHKTSTKGVAEMHKVSIKSCKSWRMPRTHKA